MIGCGGTIGFVGPLAELFGGAPALLLGIEDPQSNAHAPNESLHEGDWKNLMRSLARLFAKLGVGGRRSARCGSPSSRHCGGRSTVPAQSASSHESA
jgi:hypothetical protein